MKAELLIANVLRYGVLLCLAVIGAGLAGQKTDWINVGLMMLIALPILRVALTTVIFFREKDWIFFALTLVVLTVLLTGVIFGRAL